MMLMRCFLIFFFLIFFIKAYVVDTHLNCIDICLYKEIDKKYTGCNLRTTKLLDCIFWHLTKYSCIEGEIPGQQFCFTKT